MHSSELLWFSISPNLKPPKLRLFCFPYAGGGGAVYREWHKVLSPEIEVLPIVMPGREKRFSETPFRTMDELVDALMKGLQPFTDVPFAFFGHSLGALISFELSRKVYREWGIQPVRLYVSGKRAPHIVHDQAPIYNLPRDKFLAKLQDLNGTPNEIMQNHDLFEIYELMLRADFEICDTYKFVPGAPVNYPISVFGGLQDIIAEDQLDAWADLTTSSCKVQMLEGDHFFIHKQQNTILNVVQSELALALLL